MIRSILCGYSNAYMRPAGTITVRSTAVEGEQIMSQIKSYYLKVLRHLLTA